ncbi:hypothetical protein HGB13_03435 [bacterium]|nr:hypothetical protein [bacterium]
MKRQLLVTVFSSIIICLVAIVATWFFMDKNIMGQKVLADNKIKALEEDIRVLKNASGTLKIKETAWSANMELSSEAQGYSETESYTFDIKEGDTLDKEFKLGYKFTIDKITESEIIISSNKKFSLSNNLMDTKKEFTLKTNSEKVEINSATLDAGVSFVFSYEK